MFYSINTSSSFVLSCSGWTRQVLPAWLLKLLLDEMASWRQLFSWWKGHYFFLPYWCGQQISYSVGPWQVILYYLWVSKRPILVEHRMAPHWMGRFLGLISQNFFGTNLHSFCKLDHFINIGKICYIAVKRSNLQVRVRKSMEKRFYSLFFVR